MNDHNPRECRECIGSGLSVRSRLTVQRSVPKESLGLSNSSIKHFSQGCLPWFIPVAQFADRTWWNLLPCSVSDSQTLSFFPGVRPAAQSQCIFKPATIENQNDMACILVSPRLLYITFFLDASQIPSRCFPVASNMTGMIENTMQCVCLCVHA